MLGERVALANPLDYHTYVWGDPDAMTAAFTAMVRGPADLHLLFADLPRADRCADDDWTAAITAFAAGLRRRRRAGRAGGRDGRQPGRPAGRRVGPARAGGARPARAWPWRRSRPRPAIGRAWARPARAADPVGTAPRGRLRAAGGCPGARRGRRASDLLRGTGVPVPAGAACCSRRTPRPPPRPSCAGPVVVKGLGVAHKTDQHAVRLGLVEPAAGAAAARRSCWPGSRRCWSSGMVSGGVAELLVGVRDRPGLRPGAQPSAPAAS